MRVSATVLLVSCATMDSKDLGLSLPMIVKLEILLVGDVCVQEGGAKGMFLSQPTVGI